MTSLDPSEDPIPPQDTGPPGPGSEPGSAQGSGEVPVPPNVEPEKDGADENLELAQPNQGGGLRNITVVVDGFGQNDVGSSSPPPTGEEPQSDGRSSSGDHRPVIRVDDGDLATLVAKCLAVLISHAFALGLYFLAGRLVKVKLWKDGIPIIVPCSAHDMRHDLSEWAHFVTVKDGATKRVFPPMAAVSVILAQPAPPFFPLVAVARAPFFTADGLIATQDRYYADCGILLLNGKDAALPRVPPNPTREQLNASLVLIFDELLVDFPYDSEASRAHALLMLLGPIIRLLVPGPVPMFGISKPHPGSGAGLLLSLQALISIGSDLTVCSPGRSDSSVRKLITACLLDLPRVLVLDNIHHALNSAPLAAVLTTGVWQDRVLTRSKVVRLTTSAVTWVVTGNDLELSPELSRRTLPIVIDPGVPDPQLRRDFRHADLKGWALEHLAELRAALMTLVQAWLTAGRPVPDELTLLGSFEEFSRIAGGILAHAGVPGLFGNLGVFERVVESQGTEHAQFIAAWFRAFGETVVASSDLAAHAIGAGIDLGTGTVRSRATLLGLELKKLDGRCFQLDDGVSVTVTPSGKGTGPKSKASLWRLRAERADPNEEEMEAPM